MSAFIKLHESVHGRSRLVRTSEVVMVRPEITLEDGTPAIISLRWGTRIEELTVQESFTQIAVLLATEKP